MDGICVSPPREGVPTETWRPTRVSSHCRQTLPVHGGSPPIAYCLGEPVGPPAEKWGVHGLIPVHCFPTPRSKEDQSMDEQPEHRRVAVRKACVSQQIGPLFLTMLQCSLCFRVRKLRTRDDKEGHPQSHSTEQSQALSQAVLQTSTLPFLHLSTNKSAPVGFRVIADPLQWPASRV